MKKLLFFLILPLQLFSQAEIDRIRTDSDVVHFIRTYGINYAGEIYRHDWGHVDFDIFGQNRYRLKRSAEDSHFTDSLIARKWIVEDLNGDKLKDLVFYGRIVNETGVWVFIAGQGGPGQFIRLTDTFAEYHPHSIELFKNGNTNGIVLGSLVRTPWRSKHIAPMRDRYYLDTLVYKFGYFLEYNKDPQPATSFDSIEYRSVSTWIGSNSFYMRVYKNGTALFVRQRDPKEKESVETIEKLTAKTDPHEWQSLLGYMQFESLNDKYEVTEVFDLNEGVTTVYFSNGTKKIIRDYGMRGTFGLQTLYEKMDALSKKGDWQLVKMFNGWFSHNVEY